MFGGFFVGQVGHIFNKRLYIATFLVTHPKKKVGITGAITGVDWGYVGQPVVVSKKGC